MTDAAVLDKSLFNVCKLTHPAGGLTLRARLFPMASPVSLTRRSRSWAFAGFSFLAVAVYAPTGLRAQAVAADPPRSAWLDLRPPAPGALPQTVAAWVESIEFLPPIPGDTKVNEETISPPATFRLRLARPVGVGSEDDLLLRLFFRDGPAGTARPRVTAWDELGHRLLDSGPLGEGLPGALNSSEALTVPMAGVDYLEISAPDVAAVRGAQLQWLQRREAHEPADLPAATAGEPERARELRMVAAAGRGGADGYLYGTLTAALQPGTVSLVGAGANSQQPGGLLLDFELERPPLLAMLTFEILTDGPVDAPPLVFVNGRTFGSADLQLPDLDDPGFQGEAASVPTGGGVTAGTGESVAGTLGFRYTGWVRARKVLPVSALRTGVNRLLLQLSNDSAAGAVRAVELQLKYSWEKLDYVVSPALVPPPSDR